jgi:hypothetical protein
MTTIAESVIPKDGDGGSDADPLTTFILLMMRGAAGRGEFVRAAVQREIRDAFDALAKETNR